MEKGNEVVRKGSPAELLWSLLDDIDTMSDVIKPHDLKGYQAFYSQALRLSEKRHKVFFSDGYKLWTEPLEQPSEKPPQPEA